MSLREAVQADINRIPDPEVRDSALAALALAMADAMDHKASALMGHELRETLDRLRELSPPLPVADELDDLEARRDKRRNSA